MTNSEEQKRINKLIIKLQETNDILIDDDNISRKD